MPRLLRVILALLCASGAFAQGTGTITGTVADSASGTAIRGASVAVVGTALETSVRDGGRFSLSGIVAGEVSIRVRAPGFAPSVRAVTVRAGQSTNIVVSLVPLPMMLNAARADFAHDDRRRFDARPEMGTISLGSEALKSVPKLGEADPVRVLQLLPAVQAKNDFSSGYSVRGGEGDQNLVLLDGYPLYNPFHVGGVFSTFINSAVRNVELRTGSIPARQGGRLSSVVDVQSADEYRTGLHGTAEVSALAATTRIGSSSEDQRRRWSIAARRTYADKLIGAVSDEQMPYWFHDLHGRALFSLANGATLSMTAYGGRDVLDGSYATFQDDSRPGADGGGFYYSWGNSLAGVTLEVPLRWRPALLGGSAITSLRANQSLSISRFTSRLNLGEGASRYANDLTDLRAAGELVAATSNHERTFGYEVSSFDVAYSVDEGEGSLNTRAHQSRPFVAALHAEDLWRPSPLWLISAGLRAETMPLANWSAISPRVSVRRFTSTNSALTLSAGRLSQWLHSLQLEDNPIRLFDAWRASDERNPVSGAWHVSGAFEQWLTELRLLRIEAFYKAYDRLLEPDVTANTSVKTDAFVPVEGTSYGADIMLRQVESGPFSGWIAYTWSVSTRRQDTISYVPAQDRRHDLNIVASWRFGSSTLGARVGYGSGMPYTEIIGSLPRRRWDPVTNTFGGSGGRVRFEALGARRNAARLPPTRRIDIYAERRFTVKRKTVTGYASVLNASNAENVLYYTYDYTTGPPTRRGVSQLPIIPSLGVTIAF
jgi:hypothetical protein